LPNFLICLHSRTLGKAPVGLPVEEIAQTVKSYDRLLEMDWYLLLSTPAPITAHQAVSIKDRQKKIISTHNPHILQYLAMMPP
jgi:hypothetical protein